jgi:hypothetical protein
MTIELDPNFILGFEGVYSNTFWKVNRLEMGPPGLCVGHRYKTWAALTRLPRGVDGDFDRRMCLEYAVDFALEIPVKYHTGHGYETITRSDEQGARNPIPGHNLKLVKFEDEPREHPKQTASIHAQTAFSWPTWRLVEYLVYLP